MATILEDIQNSAEWVSNALVNSGYKADFSPDSLIEIDRFFSEHVRNGNATREGLLAKFLALVSSRSVRMWARSSGATSVVNGRVATRFGGGNQCDPPPA